MLNKIYAFFLAIIAFFSSLFGLGNYGKVKTYYDVNYGSGAREIYDLAVPAEWNGKTVGGLDIRKKYNLNLLAVRKNGHPSIAVTSETVLQENQTILVLGTWKDVQKCFRL